MQPAQRRLAIAIALSALAALGAAAIVFWSGIERRIHLLRLRNDPSLLDDLLACGSQPKEAACLDFVDDAAGKEALLRLYLVEFARAGKLRAGPGDEEARPAFIGDEPGVPFERAAIAIWEEGRSCLTWRKGGHASYSMANLGTDRRLLRAVLGLLPRLAGATVRLPEGGGFEFRLARAAELREDGPAARWAETLRESGWGEDALRAVVASVHPAAEIVCFFRRT